MSRLRVSIDQAKELVATGRRLEARKLVEEFISSAAKGKASPEESQFFVKNVLEDFDRSDPGQRNSVVYQFIGHVDGSHPGRFLRDGKLGG